MSLRFATALLTLAAVLGVPLLGHAQGLTPEQLQQRLREQRRGQGLYGQQPNVQREGLNASGVLKSARGPVLQIQTDEGDNWVVQVQPNRPWDISFTGAAEPSWLRPGMLVQFSSRLGKRGQAEDPITQLTVFTMKEGYQLGVLSDSAIGGGENPSAGLFDDPAEKPKEKKTKVKTDENTVYRIAGQITKISRTGELTINAGGTTVKADLADDARISVDVSDLSYAVPGDKVELRGWYVAGQKGQGYATEVRVSAAQPLEGPKKKPLPGAKAGEDPAKADAKAAEEATKKLFE
jgi:hypothetical protein